MKRTITITVKANARHNEGVVQMADGSFVVRVKAPAREGLANVAVRKLIAKHFAVPASAVTIVRGQTAKTKTLIVDDGA